jgi:hypothetical protein
MIRRRIAALYALDTRVRWAADPAQPYVVERWRYVESHTGTYNEYLLRPSGGATVAWVNEADIVGEDETLSTEEERR